MRHYLFLAALFVITWTGCKHDGEKMLNALEEQGVGMIIDNHGETTTYCLPGVQDLLRLTAEEPERLKGAVVADKRVGKAAACLLIEGGVKRVNTPLVSTPAREMLEAAGIPLTFCEGERFNLKLTTPDDLVFAQAVRPLMP